MKRYACIVFLCILYTFTSAQEKPKTISTKYVGKESFLIEGVGVPEADREDLYDRLPASYKDKVRKAVWDLSKNSAGLTVRFNSNSSAIKVKWDVFHDTTMNHFAPTGIKGVDLYVKLNGTWRYVNTGRPVGKHSEATLASTLSPEMREFKLYLPLYDGTTKLEIGVDSASTIQKPAEDKRLPIVFYGTSITQGGCASRPGMAYTNIISRKMNVDCINLGFSGNGKMETPVVEVIAGIKASFYVIDCLPNMTPQEVTERVIPLAELIRSKNPNTPIVFVENIDYAKMPFEAGLTKLLNDKNQALKTEFDKLTRKGMKNIVFIDTKDATGTDGESSVDGVHLTDLGFLRFSDFLVKTFQEKGLKVVQ
jgi:hypothetical protein